MKYFLYCLQHYADFNGRARRSEYWYYTLFNFLIYIACVVLALLLAIATDNPGFIALAYLWGLATLLPTIAVCVRRLHDTGKSGWFYLTVLIPLVGGILMLVWMCTDSELGHNGYGPNPKGVGNDLYDNPYQG